MRRAALIAALILASCVGDGQTSSQDTPAPTLTTLAAATTLAPTATTVVEPEATTTTSTTTTTTMPANAAPAFGLTQVVFGDGGFVVITNWGNDTGTLHGYWLCQEVSYMALPDVALAPGEQAVIGLSKSPPPDLAGMTATVDLGPAIGPLALDSGEVALYDAIAFDDPEHITAYVEWGEGVHSRSALAAAAGVWEGDAVDVFDDAPSISSGVYPAIDNLAWFADIGG
ncbi:MAG: hypothetical protein GY788_03390 [bacterium]|nr:hypothetical protein [bacterium]